jgi:hypothetical protein
MICFDNSFISELINFWFGGEIPKGLNSHFIFSITTFFVSLILVILNSILVKYKSVDLLKLKFKDGDDGNNNGDCSDLTQDECTENPDCEWGEIATPMILKNYLPSLAWSSQNVYPTVS